MNDQYRLHIDIVLSSKQDDAKMVASSILSILRESFKDYPYKDTIQVRLGNDSDRGKKNYLEINENGHAANGKQPLFESSDATQKE